MKDLNNIIDFYINKTKKLTENSTQEDIDEVFRKKRIIEKFHVEEKFNKLQKRVNKSHRLKNVNVDTIPENFHELLDQSDEQIKTSIYNRLPFITPKLTELVPLFSPSLILIGASTGNGKTTVASNIVHSLLKEDKRSLVISNEELEVNIFNRVACLELGLDINNRNQFSVEDEKLLKEYRRTISNHLRVVDVEYDKIQDVSTSIEGIEAVLESVIRNDNDYDCIILDYYQKVTKSNSRNERHYQILAELTDLLDKYYKVIKCPIVVLCQLHPLGSNNSGFEDRIKGGRSIIMASTFALELKTNKQKKESEWICHKHRFGQQNKSVKTKWVNGKYIDMGGDNE